VVRIPAGQKHWHGASPQSAMTHLAVSEHRDGTTVEWMEKVSDDQYHAAVSPQQGDARPSGPRQQALAPGLAGLTDDVLFGDVWRRQELSPRDRSLVTIAALAGMGQDDQLELYTRRGLESGLTRAQITEALTHLSFYAGWPRATRALTAVTRILSQ
jgi:4-carboxymuconolactone decarboxylase